MERQIYILYYIRKLKFYYYKYNFSHILKSQGLIINTNLFIYNLNTENAEKNNTGQIIQFSLSPSHGKS